MVVQLLSCLSFSARALGSHRGNYVNHEVHSVYWQCISLLYFRSLPQGCYKTYEPHLVGLIMDGSASGFFPLEHAEILCSMSFFLLKGSFSEQSRLSAIMRHFHIWQSGCSSSGCFAKLSWLYHFLQGCLLLPLYCTNIGCCYLVAQSFCSIQGESLTLSGGLWCHLRLVDILSFFLNSRCTVDIIFFGH